MNNQMNFDPMTGQPINQNSNLNNVVPQSTINTDQITNQTMQVATENSFQNVEPNLQNNIQQQMQNIPTIEQTRQEFISNTQANNTGKKDEKTEGPNIALIIILFTIIFASIFFLFPYLQKVL